MTRPLGLGAAAVVVSASVLGSRVLGLLRETLLATLIGVRPEGDLYRQAFLIPDLLNYLLAGAYLTITLIPILSRHLEAGDEEGASRAFTSVFRFVTVGITALTLAMWAAAGPLVSLMFPEVADQDRLVSLTRLVLPAQVFLVTGSLLVAVQYAHRRFLVPALAPLIYNLGIIAGGLAGMATGNVGPESFLLGAVAGAALGNFGLQWVGARRTGTWLVPVGGRFAVGEYLGLALPLMLGQSVAVLDEQFVRWFGQLEVGAASALSFARYLAMVPIGVIAQAAGVAAFPFLARLAAGGRDGELVDTTGRTAANTVFLAAGAAAAVVVLARPLVRLLYQYGEFTAADADLVAGLLVVYAFSIPAWGLHQILSRHFYAKRRMWTVVAVGTAGTVVAVPVWAGFYRWLGVEGFALASVVIMTLYAAALLVVWGFDSGWAPVRRLLPAILRALAAAGAGVAAALPLVGVWLDRGSEIGVGEGLGAVLVGGVAVTAGFLGASYLLGSPELGRILKRG